MSTQTAEKIAISLVDSWHLFQARYKNGKLSKDEAVSLASYFMRQTVGGVSDKQTRDEAIDDYLSRLSAHLGTCPTCGKVGE